MPSIKELETTLRTIRTNCMNAYDASGSVNHTTMVAQSRAMKKWVADFENAYIQEAKRKPREGEEIAAAGRELVEEAWHTYEVMLEVEQRSGEPPRPARHEYLPSGVVAGETRTALLEALNGLSDKLAQFRKHTVKE